MKKILVVTNRSFQQVGGIEKHVFDVSRALTEKSNRLNIRQICFANKTTENIAVNDNYHAHHIKTWFLFDHQYPVLSISAFIQLYWEIKTFKPDVIHTHNRYMLSSISAQLLAVFFKIPLIHTEHASGINVFSNKLLQFLSNTLDNTIVAWLLKKCQVITAVSESSSQFLENRFGLQNIVVTKNFINTREIDTIVHNLTAQKQRKTNMSCIFVGRLVDSKGYKSLLHLLEINSKLLKRFTFTIVGGGNGRKLVKKAANKLLNLRYLGELPRKKTIQQLFNADIYINMSTLEGLSTTIMEAMYLNKTILATPISPNIELLSTYSNGFLFNEIAVSRSNFVSALICAKTTSARETSASRAERKKLQLQQSRTVRKYRRAYSIAAGGSKWYNVLLK